MKKLINVGEKEVIVETRGSFFRYYNRRFGKNPINDILNMVGGMTKFDEDSEESKIELAKNLNTDIMENLFYAMSVQADKEIELKYPEVEDYLDSFEEFKQIDVLFQIMPLLESCLTSNVEPKKKQSLKVR